MYADDSATPLWNGTQCAQAMPLYYDLVPAAARSKVESRLVEHIEAGVAKLKLPPRHLLAGMFGLKAVLLSLGAMGRNDLALAMMTQTDYPSYGYMLAHNATTLWESWFFSDNVYSHNHAMFSSAAVWLVASLAGISQLPSSVAFDHIYVAPQVPFRDNHRDGAATALPAAVNATLETQRGLVSVAWTLDLAQVLTITVTIPPNALATVCLPGSPLEAQPHSNFEAEQGKHVYHNIGSGLYVFKSQL